MPKKPTVGDKEMKESGSEEEDESDNESGESQDDRIDKKAAMMSLTGGREEAANKSKQLTVEQFKQLCGNREKLYNHLSFTGKVTFLLLISSSDSRQTQASAVQHDHVRIHDPDPQRREEDVLYFTDLNIESPHQSLHGQEALGGACKA